ncbi:unnamed protein product [Urochloa decumbens]|uniref:Uncharacterized protein n=2 Tax=Urochloa decumbens TaxID=240449 RepID=A0ABC8VQR0_9POAL
MGVKCRRLEGKVAVVTASTQGISPSASAWRAPPSSSPPGSRRTWTRWWSGSRRKGSPWSGPSATSPTPNSARAPRLIDTAVKMAYFEMKEAVLDKLWDINVKASILPLQDAAPHLRKGSSVIIISSVTGYNPEQGLAMYGVTKTALLGLTKALAAEMGPNTRVNCIAPGFVPTRFASFLTTNETIRKELTDKITLNRLGSVEDMAAAAAFLASDDASFVTAETIFVAGGMQSRL